MADSQTFDEQVAALRGKVPPRHYRGKKAAATPEQWAATLDYHAARNDHTAADRWKRYRDRNPNRPRYRRSRNAAQKAARVAGESKKLAECLNYRMGVRLRQRMSMAAGRCQRAGSAVNDLGCSIEYFRAHVESMLAPGLSWADWGELWHLDHIYPLSKADLTDRAQFLAAANWRNFQPLPIEDNLHKSDSVSPAARERFEVLANFVEVLRG